MTPVPVLCYHAVADHPPAWIAPYTVSPARFGAHLDAVLEAGRVPVTISALAEGLAGRGELPPRPVAITFDDGFADFATVALPALASRGLVATLYLPTAALAPAAAPPARPAMLAWPELSGIAGAGVELGAHAHTHVALDTVRPGRVVEEVTRPKALLEDALGREVASFAYPHGYWTPRVRAAVALAGYRSACAVGNALASPADDPLALPRLLVRAGTSGATLRAWLEGAGAPVGPLPHSIRTRSWRWWRRALRLAGWAAGHGSEWDR